MEVEEFTGPPGSDGPGVGAALRLGDQPSYAAHRPDGTVRIDHRAQQRSVAGGAPGLTTDQETPTLEHNAAATLVANGGRVAVANVRSTT